MKRAVLKLASLAVVIYLVALLALFPASLALRWFVPNVPGLTFGPASGTIWNGDVVGVQYAEWNPGRIEWQLDPLSLLALQGDADVQVQRVDGTPITFNIVAGLAGNLVISELRGAVTLGELERARLMPRNIASGEILVNLSRLETVNQRPVAATGRAGLSNLESTLLPGIALGSYEGELETADNGISAVFREVEAPLRVSGEALLQPDGRYTVSGHITPVNETPEALRRGLGLMGSPDASGRYRFNFSGQL